MSKKKYWEFKAKANSTTEADLYLYIEIASWGGGYCAHSAQSFKDELDSMGDIDTLNIYVNCPGGDVFEGYAIFNMLERMGKACQINVVVDGMAASIASIIAMSGTHISMPSNAMMMIHRASSYVYGNSDQLTKCINLLGKIDSNMKQTYIKRSNGKLDEETLDTWFSSGDKWLTAQECLQYGLCDEITDEIQISAKYDNEVLGNYTNVPKAFLNAENEEKPLQKPVMDEETKVLIERINNKTNLWNGVI